MKPKTLVNEEACVLGFQKLYSSYGYNKFKMNRFEEYDLYADNKSFLVCDNVITFTDTNGRLLALKPDVTLSIVKNANPRENELEKLYYSENVYRVASKTKEFKEIVQVGLECIGSVDAYSTSEVILLAAKSLEMLGCDYILDISHMSFAAGLLAESGMEDEKKALVMKYIGEKNIHMIKALCGEAGIKEDILQKLVTLAQMYEPMESALEILERLITNDATGAAYKELCAVKNALDSAGIGEHVRLDFSLVNDLNYYNGITFAGYVRGVPQKVLSGGRYDNLMKRFGKECGAIGFAVYLDALEQLLCSKRSDEVDVLILYDDTTDISDITRKADSVARSGKRVRMAKHLPVKFRYNEIIDLTKKN